MAHWTITEADRDPVTGRIMVEAEQRAAARSDAPETPTEQARRTRTLTNRRGAEVSAAPASSTSLGRKEIAGIVGAVLLVLIAIAVINVLPQPSPSTDKGQGTTGPAAALAEQPPSAAPAATDAPAQVDAYAAPDGQLLGPIDASAKPAYRHSQHPGWAGVRWQGAIVWVKVDQPLDELPDLAKPTPAPTPIVVERIVEVEPPCSLDNPRYTAQLDVSLHGRPLGQATGASCDSQAEAQERAEATAAEMRANAAPPPAPCPTWAGAPFVKPDCEGE